MALTGWEIGVVGLILVAIFIWGPGKIPQFFRAIGQAKREFEAGKNDSEARS